MTSTDRKTELLTTLTDGIAALATSDQWQRWLAAQSRFHSYSFNNVLLILSQRADATRVAGFHTWKNFGRTVCNGEKAIWIMAPMTRRVDDDQAGGDSPGDEKTRRVLAGFKAVPVFDISQTDGEPLPEICNRLHGDEPGVYAQLVAVGQSIGYTVEETSLSAGVNGDCTFDKRRIRLEERNAPAQQVKTLAHELAHAMLHEDYADRALAELEAESIAYIVCASLGIDSSDYSFGYVAGWAGGGDEATASIKAVGSRIQSTADRILSSIDAAPTTEAAA